MKLKKRRLTIIFFILILTITVGCSKEEENEEYSTVSNMIVERNKARFSRAAQDASSSKKLVDNETPLQDDDIATIQKERQKIPAITFEENVKIVSESSGEVIGTGIASLDKSGRIVSIRVKNR